uniref:Lipocalin n=1 Tax=Rhipicephalus zambeziensis TaxID=60191 RepID=A0A224YDE0_9ACAR
MLGILTCLLADVVVRAAAATAEPPMYADSYEAYRYEDASKVLQYTDDIYLYRASYGWGPGNTRCMKSTFLKKEGKMVHRTLEYYGIPVQSTQFQYNVMNLWMKVIKPEKSQPYIYASQEKNKVQKKTPEKLKDKQTDMVPTVVAPRAEDDEETTVSQKDYVEYVLYADDKCVLIGHYNQTGRVACYLWVTSAAVNNPLSHCNFIITALCVNPIYNAYKYEEKTCKDFDVIFKRQHSPRIQAPV